MAYHSWQNKAPSKEFDEGHAATFGEKVDPFCTGCGLLPHFCECKFVEVATKAHAAGKDCNMLVPGAGGLEAWLPHFCECADTREPDDCQIACESTQHCGHPKKFHFKGGSCCVGGCKCRGYFVGPAT